MILAGTPACGKTQIATYLIAHHKANALRPTICKIDCIASEDDLAFKALGIPVSQGLSGAICPDHYFATNLLPIFEWGQAHGDLLIIETAGLCNRCAPFTERALNLCVVDAMGSIKAPSKLGPILTTADAIVLTKSDLITQAEREVLTAHLLSLNPTAKLFEVNGITGFGTGALYRWALKTATDLKTLEGDMLRYDMPAANCAYCVGERRLGTAYAQGILYPIALGGTPYND